VVNGSSSLSQAPRPAAVRAEAAAWVARLQSPGRDRATEQAFRLWMEADPAHAAAFDRATQVWEGIGGAAVGMRAGPGARARQAVRMRVAASLAAVAVVAGAGTWGLLRDPVYATKVGEQRIVRLTDGSRLTLNTDTKVVVHYTEGRRDLRLARGEAQFDVAKNPNRPFVVTAEGQQVRALGTSFVIRDDGKAVSVTLLEGKVTVTPARGETPAAKVVHLTPGQRVRVGEASPARVDRPRLEAVTAWRSGEILLDDTPLSQAVAEMNRYSPTPLEIESTDVASLRVTGIFKSGESQAFARTVAAQYGLAVVEQPNRILLAEALTSP
jgi:transmembrane sensor